MFETKGIIIDGGRLKNEPWEVFSELEKELGLEAYFNKDRFLRRSDGYYWRRFLGRTHFWTTNLGI